METTKTTKPSGFFHRMLTAAAAAIASSGTKSPVRVPFKRLSNPVYSGPVSRLHGWGSRSKYTPHVGKKQRAKIDRKHSEAANA